MNNDTVLRILSSFSELNSLLNELEPLSLEVPQTRRIILGAGTDRSFKDDFLKTGLAEKLLRSGFSVFAIVGANAEKYHDELDWIVIDWKEDNLDQPTVLTTWNEEDEDLEGLAASFNSRYSNNPIELIAILNSEVPADERLRLELLEYTSEPA